MDASGFSQAKQDQTRRLSNSVLRRTLVNVVVFAVVYLALFLGFMNTLGSSLSNLAYNLVGQSYWMHTAIANLFLVCVAVGFIVGIVLVVRSGINRALRYFDLLLDSVTDVLAKSEGPVVLPSELAPTALFLNGIKAEGERSERAAKAAEERKNELVVYLAHDIKTPLTSIIGYLTLLEESPDLPVDVRARYTGITLAKAYRLEELLDEFFEITRYNLQTIPIERSRFDGALFVSQVIEEFYPLAEGERSERAAKAAEERKNELVVYLAHDIKTPLTSIIGYLTLLEESPDLPVDVRARYTGITLAKAYRLEELLDEFFEITRYNLQTIPIERSRFDGALFVSQVIEEFYPLAEGRSLSLVFDGPDELPVFADAGRVARVLNNVLKNAVAYADAGTEVRVRTGLVVAPDGFVWWELTVTDRGRELSPEHLERIFEKFFRADAARGSDGGGAGLGLAIAREIARAHGGDIYATSDAGLTSFTVWIPQGPSVGK